MSIVQSEISRLPRNASLTRDTRTYQQFRVALPVSLSSEIPS
ncbi:MAG TPA: hypothetical protein VIW92_02740 [Thermoanaerobaculia bacterium]